MIGLKGSCEDCKFNYFFTSKDCGHHFRDMHGALDLKIPSETALDRFNRCDYYKKYQTNMDLMRSALEKADAETFYEIISNFMNISDLKTDEDRIKWLNEEADIEDDSWKQD